MKKLLAAVCGSVCLLGTHFAKADTVFCNNYSSRIHVMTALGGLYVGGNLDCGGGNQAVEAIGWYNANPGQCVTTYSGCYGENRIDWFAIADNGAYWAGGLNSTSLSTSAFDFCENDPSNCRGGNCPPHLNFGPVGSRLWDNMNDCGFLGLGGWGGTIDLN
jgi:hypothetical protein